MLKPKYVHGLNADQAPASLLHRLQHGEGIKAWPFPDPSPDDTGDRAGDGGDADIAKWTFVIG